MKNLIRRSKVALDYIFIAAFLAILLLPLTDTFYPIAPKVDLSENRHLMQVPEKPSDWPSLERYPAAFEAFFKDNFGFRKNLIRLHTLYKTKLFSQSPNRKVTIGRSGWLYFTGEDESLLQFQKPLSQRELQLFLNGLKERADWFNRHGIPFVVVIVPEKQSIYPEFLPEPQAGWSHYNDYDQLLKFLKAHSEEALILDVKAEMLTQKALGRKIYYQTDSHWNHAAAFLAYRKIMEALKLRGLPVVGKTSSDFNFVSRPYSGDLSTVQLGIQNLFVENSLFMSPRNPPTATIETMLPNDVFDGVTITQPLVISKAPSSIRRNVLVFRDSQFIPIIPLFAETFARVVCLSYWEKQMNVEKIFGEEKPDIVIHIMVERNMRLLPMFQAPVRHSEKQK